MVAGKALIDAGEDLHAKHAVRMPGMGSGIGSQGVQSMLGMLQGLLNPEDSPPPPDTSTPLGEKLSELKDLLDARKQALAGAFQERIAAMATGDFGKGASSAEMGRNSPELRKVVAELEAYATSSKSASKD